MAERNRNKYLKVVDKLLESITFKYCRNCGRLSGKMVEITKVKRFAMENDLCICNMMMKCWEVSLTTCVLISEKEKHIT